MSTIYKWVSMAEAERLCDNEGWVLCCYYARHDNALIRREEAL